MARLAHEFKKIEQKPAHFSARLARASSAQLSSKFWLFLPARLSSARQIRNWPQLGSAQLTKSGKFLAQLSSRFWKTQLVPPLILTISCRIIFLSIFIIFVLIFQLISTHFYLFQLISTYFSTYLNLFFYLSLLIFLLIFTYFYI